jgi:hypothetical protein
MAEGSKYNCTVTFADNYDDAYQSSPAWNPAIIARRPDGGLWESRNWTGENSYIIGMAKYMKGPGIQRVQYTCQHYNLHDTTHIDVLSYYSIRNDWDPVNPASGIQDLEEGRYKVLTGFKEYGVDVSSEALRYAFIGKVTWFNYADGLSTAKDPFGGEAVPILPLVYRRVAIWGSNSAPSYPDRILDSLFWNIAGRIWLTNNTNLLEVTDLFYLIMVPWFKIQKLDIESYHHVGDNITIQLSNNSSILLNRPAKTYSVYFQGTEIARNESTFCQLDNARLALYALKAGQISATLPTGWDSTKLVAVALDVDKPFILPVESKNGTVTVSVPARRPVIVYRNGPPQKAHHV